MYSATASIAQKPQRSPASGLPRRTSAKSWWAHSWRTVAASGPGGASASGSAGGANQAVRVGIQ